MGQLKPRTWAGKTWTKARYFQFIRSALRQAFQRYPVKQKVKNANRTAVTGKRHKWLYTCAECAEEFMDKEVQVYHIIPAGSLNDFDDLPSFVKRLYCEPEDMQILCKPCHAVKTAAERKARS
jgi:5-methylcytosine-specific restriction endonuclease McrA